MSVRTSGYLPQHSNSINQMGNLPIMLIFSKLDQKATVKPGFELEEGGGVSDVLLLRVIKNILCVHKMSERKPPDLSAEPDIKSQVVVIYSNS